MNVSNGEIRPLQRRPLYRYIGVALRTPDEVKRFREHMEIIEAVADSFMLRNSATGP